MNDEVNTEIHECDGSVKVDARGMAMIVLLAVVAGLAAMGIVFCWCCPDRLHDVGGVALRWCFKRQVVWNLAGVCVALVAVLAGWRRLLKSAPLLFVGWIALWLFALSQPVVDGSCGVARIGPIMLGVWSLFPVALALFAAWLRERYLVGARKFLCAVCIGALAVVVVNVAASPDRIARINSFFAGEPRPELPASECMSGFVQHQTCEAFAQSHWFAPCGTEILQSLPGTMSYSMPASSAVVFGKWFMALAWMLVSVLVLALALIWRRTSDVAMRTFIVFAGLGFVIPFTMGHCACLGLTPMMYTVAPLVSYDAGAVLASWFGAGILVALSADCILPAVKNCTSRICLSDLCRSAPLQHIQDIKEGAL